MVLYSRNLIISLLFFPIFLGLVFGPIFFPFQEVMADIMETSVAVHVCGDGVTEAIEVCDDGATNNGTYGYCKADCSGTGPYCGDGTLQSANEECDDGNNVSGDGCSSTCETEGVVSPPPSGGGGGGVVVPTTKVVLAGKAYSGVLITILQDGKVVTTIKADSGANFKVELTTLTAGVYTFGLWAEDKEGRRSLTFSFTLFVSSGMITTISGIFIPPTIELEKVNVSKGETLNILGQTAPESELTISVESPQIVKKTIADEEGDWDYPLDTTPLDEGFHTTRAKAETPEGLFSSYSKVLGFYIGKYTIKEICPRANFNKDGRINLIDFSIMLYWWGKYNPCVDQNQDGMVNLPDFSILMYWWSG